MRRLIFEILGVLLVLGSVGFFFASVRFLADRDYIAGILEIFVGFALVRAGLELVKLGALAGDRGTT